MIDGASQQGSERDRPHARGHDCFDGFLDLIILEQLDSCSRHRGQLGSHPRRARRIPEPCPEPCRRVCFADALGDLSRSQEVALDELAEAAAYRVLAFRYERGVWDRYPERVLENRGDGEPIGNRANHGGF